MDQTARRALLPVLGFAALIMGLLGLVLSFEGPRVAVSDSVERLLAASTSARMVYVETEPLPAAVSSGGGDAGYLSLKFRIGLPKDSEAAFDALEPEFYGQMLREFTSEPVAAEPETGRLDLLAIEARVRGLLDGMLGAGVVDTVRVSEIRRRPI